MFPFQLWYSNLFSSSLTLALYEPLDLILGTLSYFAVTIKGGYLGRHL